MTIGEKLSRELLDWRRMSPGLDRILAVDSELDDNQRRIALDVAAVVGPRTARFYAAVAVLTLGQDKKIADAVRDLAEAVGALLEMIGGKEKKYARARERVGNTLATFRSVADQQRR
jgi:hypothetical protein